jgi:uncharacterized protein YoxC
MQNQFNIIWIFLGTVFIITFWLIARTLIQTLQQIKSTARTVEKTIEENQELLENLKKMSRQLNEQISELAPVVTSLNDMSQKYNNLKTGFMSTAGIISNLLGTRLGKIPAFIAGVSWIYKKFKKGGKQSNV